MRIRTAVVCHGHGHNVLAARTAKGLAARPADYVREWWGEGKPMPEDGDEAVRRYFSGLSSEGFSERELEV